MRLTRTTDPQEVRAVFEAPGVREHIWDRAERMPVPIAPTIYHLLAKEQRFSDGSVEDCMIGALMFVPMNLIAWNPHIAVLQKYRGCGTELMRAGMEWMYENTPCEKLLAYPPEFNAPMIRVFEKCGFAREGYSPRSFRWHGALCGRLLMGADKPASVANDLYAQIARMG